MRWSRAFFLLYCFQTITSMQFWNADPPPPIPPTFLSRMSPSWCRNVGDFDGVKDQRWKIVDKVISQNSHRTTTSSNNSPVTIVCIWTLEPCDYFPPDVVSFPIVASLMVLLHPVWETVPAASHVDITGQYIIQVGGRFLADLSPSCRAEVKNGWKLPPLPHMPSWHLLRMAVRRRKVADSVQSSQKRSMAT
jgi:hypothetical protein